MIELAILYWYVPVIAIVVITVLIKYPELFIVLLEAIFSIFSATSDSISGGGDSGGGGSDVDF